MAGYVIFDVEVTDPELHAQFREQVDTILPAYDGKHVVRGGQLEVLEGSWHPSSLVIMEFANAEQAKEFVNSPEFTGLREMRSKCTGKRNVVVVAGV